MFDYFESSGGVYSHTLFYGLQTLIKKYLTTRVTKEMVEEANTFITAHGESFPYDGWMNIVNYLEGKLPIRINFGSKGKDVHIEAKMFLKKRKCYIWEIQE
jgi:nicotinamide phosphoribosyltransferase